MGPVAITLPDSGERFWSMQVIDEDHYIVGEVAYDVGSYTYDRGTVGIRYLLIAVRTLVDPDDPADIDAVHAGGNPDTDATYVNVTPAGNDGFTVHRLTVKDVPVGGFWSISVHNPEGYFQESTLGAYTVNGATAVKAADGSVTVRFGGCDGDVANCFPIMPGRNYTVRLYRPRPEILDGEWKLPDPQEVSQ